MPFNAAIALLTAYRNDRDKSHRNVKAQAWFSEAGSAATMDDVLKTFDSSAENADWSQLVAGSADYLKLQSVRMKIAFLAGCRHDLRNQYAIAATNEGKTPLDFVRHARNESMAANYQTAMLKRAIDLKAQGVS